MEREIFIKAIQGFVNDTTKNIPRFISYAKKLQVIETVKNIVGVWL